MESLTSPRPSTASRSESAVNSTHDTEGDRPADPPPPAGAAGTDECAFYSTYPDDTGEADTEFKQKYPPDRFGEEASANARVWKIYRDEATSADKSMLDGWNKTLDILLIFAGLFSAVSTAFLIESYKLLQVDNTEYIANALYSFVTNATVSAAGDVLLSPPGSGFRAHQSSRWINGLWFCSLVLSLSTALLSILAKQWLEEYHSRVFIASVNYRHWARRHVLYNQGLHRWQTPAFISLMPVILHVSLFFFLIGLYIFLHQLDTVIAAFVLCLAAPLLAFYVLSTILPVMYTDCPWLTAVTRHIYVSWNALLTAAHRLRISYPANCAIRWLYYRAIPCLPKPKPEPVTDMGEKHNPGLLELLSLQWLIHASPSHDIIAAGVQAIGALSPVSTAAGLLHGHGFDADETLRHIPDSAKGLAPVDAARYARTLVFLGSYRPTDPWLILPWIDACNWRLIQLTRVFRGKTPPIYDLPLLASISRYIRSGQEYDKLAQRFRLGGSCAGRAPFLSSTILLVLKFLDNPSMRFLIHVFHVQRLDRLDDSGLSFIARRMCEAMKTAGITGPRVTYCAHCGCLEILCQAYFCRERLELDSDDVSLLVEAIEFSLESQGVCSGARRGTGFRITHFLKFVLSEHCLQEGIPRSISFAPFIIDVMGSHVSTEVIPRDKALMWHPEFGYALAKVLRALPVALSARAERTSTSDPRRQLSLRDRLAKLCFATCRACEPRPDYWGWLGPNQHPIVSWQMSPSLSGPSQRLHAWGSPLHLLREDGATSSAWRLLIGTLKQNDALGLASSDVFMIVDTLTTLLCAMSRGGSDVSVMFKELFFCDDVALTLIEAGSCSYRSVRVRFRRIAIHCMELQPTWWSDVFQLVLNTRGADHDHVMHARLLDKTLRNPGPPCNECPEPVLGAVTEHANLLTSGRWLNPYTANIIRPLASV